MARPARAAPPILGPPQPTPPRASAAISSLLRLPAPGSPSSPSRPAAGGATTVSTSPAGPLGRSRPLRGSDLALVPPRAIAGRASSPSQRRAAWPLRCWNFRSKGAARRPPPPSSRTSRRTHECSPVHSSPPSHLSLVAVASEKKNCLWPHVCVFHQGSPTLGNRLPGTQSNLRPYVIAKHGPADCKKAASRRPSLNFEQVRPGPLYLVGAFVMLPLSKPIVPAASSSTACPRVSDRGGPGVLETMTRRTSLSPPFLAQLGTAPHGGKMWKETAAFAESYDRI